MPLYEYQCLKCAEKLEAIQKISDQPYRICPHCGGELKKLLSAPAIQFKGSGFYITDYARSGKGAGRGDAETRGRGDAETKEAGTKGKKEAAEKPASTKDKSSTKS